MAVRRRVARPLLWMLVVMSHGVWESFQCVSSGSQPSHRSRPGTSQEGPDDGPRVLVREGGQVFDRIGRGEDPGEKPIQMCHHRLIESLHVLCNGQFHDPTEYSGVYSDYPNYGEGVKRSLRGGGSNAMLRRLPRNVVDSCCKTSCKENFLRKYCKVVRNRPRPEPSPAPGEVPESNEVIPAEPVPEEIVQVEEEEPQQLEKEPVLYYPLFHLMKILYRQFGKGTRQRVQSSVDSSEGLGLSEENPLPLPLARVQENLAPELGSERLPSHSHSSARNQHNTQVHHRSATNKVLQQGLHTQSFGNSHTNYRNRPKSFPYSSQGSSDEEEVVSGSGNNAYTSTMPTYIIPLGKNTNDYQF